MQFPKFSKLLNTIIILFVVYYSFSYLFGDVFEGYCAVNSDTTDVEGNATVFYDSAAPNRDADSKDCQSTSGCGTNSCSVCVNGKCGSCLGEKDLAKVGTHLCGWNNSVSSDGRYNWAPENLKGTQRVFKYPNYYGYGTGSGFHYGEPYYVRTVNY